VKKNARALMVIWIAIIFVSLSCSPHQADDGLTFIVASDHRSHATEQYHSKEFTLGGFDAMKNVGQGSFMVLVGDLDPSQATDNLVKKVFGEDYPWYFVVGNHDIEVDSNIQFFRNLNKGDRSLPRLVRKGPPGSEETTYSFDWNDVHLVVLNVYFDGKTDTGADGNIVPELLEWLERDLQQNKKKSIFVFGHEPIIPVLDLDNGTQRHLGNSLDQYADNSLEFQKLLLKYGVTAYISGHTHCISYANINGLWLLSSGHIYGHEGDYTPEKLYSRILKEVEHGKRLGVDWKTAIGKLYRSEDKELKKFIFNLGLDPVKSYKDLTDSQTIFRLNEFYQNCQKGTSQVEKYSTRFWEHTEWRRSSFLKITVNKASVKVEIYRDKDFEGNYELRHTQLLK